MVTFLRSIVVPSNRASTVIRNSNACTNVCFLPFAWNSNAWRSVCFLPSALAIKIYKRNKIFHFQMMLLNLSLNVIFKLYLKFLTKMFSKGNGQLCITTLNDSWNDQVIEVLLLLGIYRGIDYSGIDIERCIYSFHPN